MGRQNPETTFDLGVDSRSSLRPGGATLRKPPFFFRVRVDPHAGIVLRVRPVGSIGFNLRERAALRPGEATFYQYLRRPAPDQRVTFVAASSGSGTKDLKFLPHARDMLATSGGRSDRKADATHTRSDRNAAHGYSFVLALGASATSPLITDAPSPAHVRDSVVSVSSLATNVGMTLHAASPTVESECLSPVFNNVCYPALAGDEMTSLQDGHARDLFFAREGNNQPES